MFVEIKPLRSKLAPPHGSLIFLKCTVNPVFFQDVLIFVISSGVKWRSTLTYFSGERSRAHYYYYFLLLGKAKHYRNHLKTSAWNILLKYSAQIFSSTLSWLTWAYKYDDALTGQSNVISKLLKNPQNVRKKILRNKKTRRRKLTLILTYLWTKVKNRSTLFTK
jgi:hypothetical protein